MKRAMRAGVLAVLAALAGLSSCIVKEVYVGDDAIPCHDDFDCRESGMPPGVCEQGVCVPEPADTTLACLGKGPPATTDEIVSFEISVTTTTSIPITNSFVRACSRLQPAKCENPLGAPTQVDTNGVAKLEVPQNFDGYFEVYGPQGPDVDDPNFVRSLVFVPPREIVRGGKGRRGLGFSLDATQSLAEFVGASFDSDSGLVLMWALDCKGDPVPTVIYKLLTESSMIVGKTKQFYAFENIPSPDATETDAAGLGGLTNLREGPMTVSATINSRNEPLVDRADAFVRNGWISNLYVSP
jgi:hypothetical protein